ncbi:orotate phosphoribosyltransferase [Patescibacteria group bacterium]|nr:orotate phosphoribosyltransferase [Patescibacteria group bacterium]
MRKEISKIVSTLLWETKAIKVSPQKPFRLVSGNYSPVYIDCRVLISHPLARDMITSCAYWLYENEKLHANYIAGGETAGIPYAAWLADRIKKPFIYVRKEPKGHGLTAQIEGDVKEGKSVLLYEDLITDGKSKINFIQAIRRAKCKINDCLVIFDREQGGVESLRQEGVRLLALSKLEDTLKFGKNSGYLSDLGHQEIMSYLKDPQKWHMRKGYKFK